MSANSINARKLFWIAFAVAFLPCVAFLYLSYVHFQLVLEHIFSNHTQGTKNYLSMISQTAGGSDEIELIARLHLEQDAMWNRQNRTNSALASRTWLRFMTTCFGSIIAFVGAIFLLSKIGRTERTEAGATASGVEFSFRSSSPGVVMILVGCALMVIPHFSNQDIESIDANLYLTRAGTVQPYDIEAPAMTPAEQYGPNRSLRSDTAASNEDQEGQEK